MGSRIIQNYSKQVYWSFWLLYTLIFLGRKNGIYMPNILNSYLTDILCVPLLLFAAKWIIQKLKRNHSLRLSIGQVIFVVVYISTVFEWWLPLISPIYTADIWDVGCYVLGGFIFYELQNLQLKSFGL